MVKKADSGLQTIRNAMEAGLSSSHLYGDRVRIRRGFLSIDRFHLTKLLKEPFSLRWPHIAPSVDFHAAIGS